MAKSLIVNGSVVPVAVDFPGIPQGVTPGPWTLLRLQFTGSPTLFGGTILAITITGDAPPLFLNYLPDFPFAISASGQLDITVELNAAVSGNYEAVIAISHTGINSPYLIPVTASVTNVGTVRVLQVSPLSWDFGSVETGEDSAQATFLVTNAGEAAITVSAPTFATLFSAGALVPTYPQVLGPGASFSFGVKFSPVAEGSIVEAEGVVINSTADDPTFPIPLSGTGALVTPVNPVIGTFDFLMGVQEAGVTTTYEADQEDLNSEVRSVVERVHNFEEPGVNKSSYAVYFKYEDKGPCIVRVTLDTVDESATILVSIGTAAADDRVRQAKALPLEVYGELIRLKFEREAGDGALSLVDYFIQYRRWSAALGTFPIPDTVIPIAANSGVLEFLVSTTGANEEQLAEDNERNRACAIEFEKVIPTAIVCIEDVPPEPPIEPPIEPECPTGGITARIHLIGSSGQALNLDEDTTDYFVTSIYIDPADYPGLTEISWQMFVQTTVNFADYTVDLVDEDGTIYDTDVVANTYSIPTMLDERIFTIDPVNPHSYMLRVRGVPGASADLVVRNWHMWLDVVDSIRVKLQIPMMFYNFGSGGFSGSEALNNYFAYASSLDSEAAYTLFSSEATLLLLERAKNLGATIRYEHEIIAANNYDGGAAVTGAIILNNHSSGNNVDESEITVVGETPARYFSDQWDPDVAVEFVDLDEFKVMAKVPGAAGQEVYFYKQSLNVIIDCPTHMQIHNNMQNDCQSTAVTVFGVSRTRFETSARMLIESSKYEPGVIWNFDATGAIGFPSRTDGTHRLIDTGGDVSGVAGSLIADSELALFDTFPLYNRLRSLDLTLIDGNHVMHVHDDGNGAGQAQVLATGVTYLIAEVERV